MNARERILARLRAAPRQPDLSMPDVAGYYAATARPSTPAARLARFRTAIEAAHAEVFETTEADWPALLARLCQEKGVVRLAYEPSAPLARRLAPEPGLPGLQPFPASVEDCKRALFDATDAGITAACGAIAETGTLVAWPGPTEPRTLSLVPPIHFVLLDAARICDDLHQAMTDGRWAERLPTNLLLISGPSKTADIQQTLAYGAHGPKELIVLLINQDPGARSQDSDPASARSAQIFPESCIPNPGSRT